MFALHPRQTAKSSSLTWTILLFSDVKKDRKQKTPRQSVIYWTLTWIILERDLWNSTSKCKNNLSDVEPGSVSTQCPLFLAGRRAAVPLWPVVCPVPQGGGEVKSWQSMKSCKKLGSWQPRSGRKTLYFPGALWHLSPKQSEGRQYAPQLARRLTVY